MKLANTCIKKHYNLDKKINKYEVNLCVWLTDYVNFLVGEHFILGNNTK